MKKTLLLAGVVVPALMGGVVLADEKVTEQRDLGGFTKIRIHTAAALEVVVGKDFAVEVSAPEKKLDNLVTTVEGDTLIVEYEEEEFHMKEAAHIRVHMPEFVALDVSGAVEADIENLQSPEFDVEVNGASSIEIDGSCGRLTVELSGASNFEGRKLECEVVRVELNGAGNVEVYASREVEVDVNGVGNVDIYGKPEKVHTDESFFSNIDIH